MKKQKIKKNTLTEHVADARIRRLINSEYKRGFMEGQQKAAMLMAGSIDTILQQYNHVALVENFSEEIKEGL